MAIYRVGDRVLVEGQIFAVDDPTNFFECDAEVTLQSISTDAKRVTIVFENRLWVTGIENLAPVESVEYVFVVGDEVKILFCDDNQPAWCHYQVGQIAQLDHDKPRYLVELNDPKTGVMCAFWWSEADLEAVEEETPTFRIGDRVRSTKYISSREDDIPVGTLGTVASIENSTAEVSVKFDGFVTPEWSPTQSLEHADEQPQQYPWLRTEGTQVTIEFTSGLWNVIDHDANNFILNATLFSNAENIERLAIGTIVSLQLAQSKRERTE